jgi:hypothetical protein
MGEFEILKFIKGIHKIKPSIIDRKDWVKYLSVRDILAEKYGGLIEVNLSKQFVTVLSETLNDHMFNNKMPPDEIAPAILNIADDILSGREPVLRAGDYISLQNYVRSQSK